MKLSGPAENKRVWLTGGAVLAVLIILAGWFLVINPELSAASSNRQQAASADQQNQALQKRNDDLMEKNNDQGALQAGLSAMLAQLPSDGALPEFIRQLSAQASTAGVTLTSVLIGAATPVVAAAQGAPTAAAPVSPAAGSTTAAVIPATSASLVQMTITINATGLGRHDLAFLRAIQWNGPRRALVTAVALVPVVGSTATAGPTTSSGITTSPTTAKTTTAKTTTAKSTPQRAMTTSPAPSTPTTSSPTTPSALSGIDGPCTLTATLTIFSAPLSPSAQADLDKLLGGK
jgi:hypothetical protein